mmetsp:Transcript_24532/g.40210  ORF Transcript_24532/g.40210 Transcript_24532/m.40210 type:complete len:142 (+) Transcript_24532:122-547(+)
MANATRDAGVDPDQLLVCMKGFREEEDAKPAAAYPKLKYKPATTYPKKKKSNDENAKEEDTKPATLKRAHDGEDVQEPVLDWEFGYDNAGLVWYHNSFTGERRALTGWMRVVENGEFWYWNEDTNECRWDPPNNDIEVLGV